MKRKKREEREEKRGKKKEGEREGRKGELKGHLFGYERPCNRGNNRNRCCVTFRRFIYRDNAVIATKRAYFNSSYTRKKMGERGM